MPKPLSAVALKSLKPGPLRREIPDGGSPGLYVVLQPSGGMSWALRCRVNGRPAKVTLGRVSHAPPSKDEPELGGLLTLAEARVLAARQRHLLGQGGDPRIAKAKAVEERENSAEAWTVDRLISAFMERHVRKEGLRSEAEIERQFKLHVLPHWSGLPVTDITRKLIIKRVDEIADNAPIMANRVLAALRSMFGWAVSRGYIESNPATGVQAPGAEIARDRVLSVAEIRAFWQCCGSLEYPFGPLLRVLLATGQRREEVAGMRFAELDFTESQWLIPRDRAKNNTESLVPLSPLVAGIIKAVSRIAGKAGYVFTTTGARPVSGWSRAKTRLDGLMHVRLVKGNLLEAEDKLPHFTLHDLRRTAASHMARLGVAPHVIEATLNHKSGRVSGIAAVYNRYSYMEEKRQALEVWATEIERITGRES